MGQVPKSHIENTKRINEINFDGIFYFTQVSEKSFQHIINMKTFVNEILVLLFILSLKCNCVFYTWGFSGGSALKNPPAIAGHVGLIWVGKIP